MIKVAELQQNQVRRLRNCSRCKVFGEEVQRYKDGIRRRVEQSLCYEVLTKGNLRYLPVNPMHPRLK